MKKNFITLAPGSSLGEKRRCLAGEGGALKIENMLLRMLVSGSNIHKNVEP